MGGFPGGPAGQESTCNAGDPGSIPGRLPREWISYYGSQKVGHD